MSNVITQPDISQQSEAAYQPYTHIPAHILTIIHQFANETKQLLHEHLIAEYLFGSYATDKHTPESDVDILILVDQFTPNIRRQMSGLASEYSLQYGLYISPIIKDLRIWKQNQEHNTLFYQDVTRYGIPI